jgi:hypothetical protein
MEVRGEGEDGGHGRERMATTGENDNNSAFPPKSSGNKKARKKTQQLAPKTEAAGMNGFWKRH